MNEFSARLRIAADYMNEHGWVQGELMSPDGRVCLTGAIQFCAPKNGDEGIIAAVLRHRGRAERWNDAAHRQESEVITFLQTEDITDADLLDTFGPQWEQVVAYVRRCATLTFAESKVLDSYVAFNRVKSPEREISHDSRIVAAADAAWSAAYDAVAMEAWNVSRYIPEALVLRHLIKEGTPWDQHEYDRRTAAWRTQIGPLHPDDAPMEAK